MNSSNYELILLCLKEQELLPYELVQIIMRVYHITRREPMLLFIDLPQFTYCGPVRDIWSSKSGNVIKEQSILYQAKQLWTGLRDNQIQLKTFDDKECFNEYPNISIAKLIKWYPCIILIPGPVWDYGISNPESQNINAIQILNGNINGKYKIHKLEEYMFWLTKSFENKDFITAQNL